MTQLSRTPPARLAADRGVHPIMLVLFAGSGCAALIYEIVWFQLPQLVIGSSAVSLAVLLATFMGGMCLGSLALPRLISARRHSPRHDCDVSLPRMFDLLGGIRETLLIYPKTQGQRQPATARALSTLNAEQEQLLNILDLRRYL